MLTAPRYLSHRIRNINKLPVVSRGFSLFPFEKRSCKVLVVGGGCGGCAIASKLTRKLGNQEIIILEPSNNHYYQPMFTLIGGGIKKLEDATKSMAEVLPQNTKWIQDAASKFDPKNNIVYTKRGDKIAYEYLVVALGLQLDYNKIPGLLEALEIEDGKVCTNYSPKYVERTIKALKAFQSGNAIFTYPNCPVKCPGSPQKILYLAEHYLTAANKRKNANLIYNTSLAVLFGIKHYADALWKVISERDIRVNLRTNLVEVLPKENKAVFENLDDPYQNSILDYEFLHVTPYMGAPDVLRECSELSTVSGYLNVSDETLQHNKYRNIFGIGDCISCPNAKTAASVAVQSKVVFENLLSVMEGKEPTELYNGYASCPLVTGYDKCILAEFDYSLQPRETFPISQNVESRMMYLMNTKIMPSLYWDYLLKGNWNGPGFARSLLSAGLASK